MRRVLHDYTFTCSLNRLISISLYLILGNVYIADYGNNHVRKVTVSTGVVTTIAGSTTSASYSGDGGQATSATLNKPQSVGLDAAGTFTTPT